MSRIFCIPGIAFLLLATIVSFLASISLPFLPALGVTRTDFAPSTVTNDMTDLRFGIWSSCFYNEDEDRTCLKNGVGYQVTVSAASGPEEITIGASWTRGLAVHPLATAITLVALCLSLSTNIFVMLLATLVSFFAAIVHLISFAIQLALFAYVRDKMKDLEVGAKTLPAPGFWLVFASMILSLLGGCTIYFGRRRDRAKQTQAAPPTATKAADLPAFTPAEVSDEKPKHGFLARFRNN